MNEEQIVELLQRKGLLLQGGHVLYPNGKHGGDYVDKAMLLSDTELAGKLAHELVMRYTDDLNAPFPDVVVGPGITGAGLAILVASAFNRMPDFDVSETVYAAYVEKDSGSGLFRLGPNYDKLVCGRNVLVVEDVCGDGTTIMSAAHAVMMAGGIVIGAAVIYNRGKTDKLKFPNSGGESIDLGVTSLVHRPHPSYTEAECREVGPCSRGERVNIYFGHAAALLRKDGRTQA